jgi:PhnB protein
MQTRLSILALSATLLAIGCEKQTPPTTTPEPVATTEPTKPPAKPIPDGYFTVTPLLAVQGVDAAVDFYVKGLAAQKLFAFAGPDGKTIHAEIKIGDSIVMIEQEDAEHGSKAPQTLGGTPAALMLYVDKVDEVVAAAVAAGATVEMPVADQFWGDRFGTVIDPSGHRWAVATHTEDLSPEQMGERAALAMPSDAKKQKKLKKDAKKGKPPEWKKVVGTPATATKPAEYHTVTVALTSNDAGSTIEFYKAAFGATERMRMPDANGRIAHAELNVGNSIVVISDEAPEMGSKSAIALGGSPVALMMYVEDVDGAFAKVATAGGKAVMPVTDMFWGDRMGATLDPSGFQWSVATHKEDLTPEEMTARMNAAKPMDGGAAAGTNPAPSSATAPGSAPAPVSVPAPGTTTAPATTPAPATAPAPAT